MSNLLSQNALPPTIGLNLLFLVPGETGGMESAARMMMPALAAQRPDIEFVAFVCEEAADSFGPDCGARIVPLPVKGRSRVKRSLFEQLRLPRAAAGEGVGLIHSLGNTGPVRAAIPTVTSINDVIYAAYPEAHSRAMRFGTGVLVPLAARHSDRVIAISQATADEIVRITGIPPRKIDVVPLAGREPAAGEPTPAATLRDKYSLGDAPVVLCVSARRGHKNLPRLIEAFARVQTDVLPQLLLPGYETGAEAAIRDQATALGVSDRVQLLGWVSDADLDGLYKMCSAFVHPSLAEGFGMPVLEAMQRGVPVATSNVSAMPEVGGEAVLYFDPFDVRDIRTSIERLLADAELRVRLSIAGRERAKEFSWKRTALGVLESYERAMAGR